MIYRCEDCKRLILEVKPEDHIDERLRKLFDPPILHKGHRIDRVP